MNSVFDGISFIKPDRPLQKEYTGRNLAPLFRREFTAGDVKSAKLYVSAPGYGYVFLNGKPVSPDRLASPVSDFRKTLWYNEYDVTALLRKGQNAIGVMCGNGWYNEEFTSPWNHNEAAWRDVPKCILLLDIDGETALVTDAEWKCLPESAVTFNALRSGETFDARLWNPGWANPGFDDGDWENAKADDTPPTGVFRPCPCEPIREGEVFGAKTVVKTGNGRYLYDFGQNLSGYVRVTATGKAGQKLVFHYSEQIKEDGAPEYCEMTEFYKQSPFQTDTLILGGEPIRWSPKFCYHGFRYVTVEGLDDPADVTIEAVFVHQAVAKRTAFACSDETLNRLFRAGQYSTLSNMFYMITDCPTREKMGWANDAQSSTEQILTDFKAEKVLEKWLQDVRDAMREDGAMPGIIPSPGWGFDWGNGPVSDGILFELPYRLYLHTGNEGPLKETLPYFRRYFAFIETQKDKNGNVNFGLDDWARPRHDPEPCPVPASFINDLLLSRFHEIAALGEKLSGGDGAPDLAEAHALREKVKREYLLPDGTCRLARQTAVAMMIYYGIGDPAKLGKQLVSLIEENGWHHDCGMVGLRRLYEALHLSGRDDVALRVITADGYPGYRLWLDLGATTLWEYWDPKNYMISQNHQMYSDFMSYLVKSVLGIRPDPEAPGFARVRISPVFFASLDYARGYSDTVRGRIAVEWKRENGKIALRIDVPRAVEATFRDVRLATGENRLTVDE